MEYAENYQTESNCTTEVCMIEQPHQVKWLHGSEMDTPMSTRVREYHDHHPTSLLWKSIHLTSHALALWFIPRTLWTIVSGWLIENTLFDLVPVFAIVEFQSKIY